jgi:hypothetical protein
MDSKESPESSCNDGNPKHCNFFDINKKTRAGLFVFVFAS